MKFTLFLPAALCLIARTLHAGGGALSFNPANTQYVEVADFQDLGIAGEVTVEFWAKTNTAGIQQSAFMLSPDDPTHRFQGHISYFNGNTYWDCGDIGAGGRAQIPNPAGSVGNWTHYAFVASQAGGYMKIYVNGVEKVSKGAPVPGFTPGGSTYTLRIGGSSSFLLNGSLDEFRLWRTPRSAAQIQSAMGSELTGSEADLVIYFKFDEAQGNIAANHAAGGTPRFGLLVNNPAHVPGVFAVTTTVDENDTPSGSAISLREALRDAAAAGGPTTVSFAPALGGQTVALGGEIAVNDPDGVTLEGSFVPGGVTIGRTAGNFRLFTVAGGRSLAVRGLTLSGGGGADFAQDGGAVFNNGNLTLSHCTLTGNRAGTGEGGALLNNAGATLALTNCTLTGNQSSSSGGAIRNRGTLTLTHCTITGNEASFGIFASGSGVYSSGPCTMSHCIVAGNGTANGADFFNSGSTGPALLTRVGANIVPRFFNSAGTLSGPDASTADPLLGALADNGGPTKTHALLPGSPAYNAGPGSTTPTDQRGLLRGGQGDEGAGQAPDLGAFEAQTPPAAGVSEVVWVTTDSDDDDTPGTVGSGLSLREAVRLAPPNGTVRFSLHSNNLAVMREISVVKNLTIYSSSGRYFQGGGLGAGRIFSVRVGVTLNLQGLSFQFGGGGGADAGGNGGAIANFGTLRAQGCSFFDNSAEGGGGAILNVGTLELTQCTLTGNSAASGGAIYTPATEAVFPASTTLTHCTISGNEARGTNSAVEGGGGVLALGAHASVTLRNTIVAGNSAESGAGPDYWRKENSPLTASGSLIGHASTTGLLNGVNGNRVGVDPLLAPLGINYLNYTTYGGPSPTLALRPGSPARNAALVLNPAITTDQRGYPLVGAPDIGAYEAGTLDTYENFIWESLPASASPGDYDGDEDYDGDGQSNEDEFTALTNPASALSVLRITAAVRSGGNLILSFPTVSGKSYTLWRSDSLATGWVNTGLAAVPGNGSVRTFTVPAGSTPARRFFRVQVE